MRHGEWSAIPSIAVRVLIGVLVGTIRTLMSRQAMARISCFALGWTQMAISLQPVFRFTGQSSTRASRVMEMIPICKFIDFFAYCVGTTDLPQLLPGQPCPPIHQG